jgi:nitroreductase
MLSIAKKTFSYNSKPNRHYMHDTGLSVSNMILQGINENIFFHQMAGFNKEKATELFKIPEDFEPVAVIALGYLGDSSTLPEELKKMENLSRKRKPLNHFAFKGEWGVGIA